MAGAIKSLATVLSPKDIAQQPESEFNDARCGEGLVWKTLISASKTHTRDLTTGIATCAPSSGHLCVHQHCQAEIYHIIKGSGIITIDGIESLVEPGSVVFIPGDAKHGIRNIDETKELVWLYVFAADDFKDVRYRFTHQVDKHFE